MHCSLNNSIFAFTFWTTYLHPLHSGRFMDEVFKRGERLKLPVVIKNRCRQKPPNCFNTAAKRMRMRQLWHFRFAQFFLVSCLFSRKFYKVCNKQLSLLLQQKSLKEYAFRFLNFISFSGKEIPNSLKQCKACEPACQL